MWSGIENNKKLDSIHGINFILTIASPLVQTRFIPTLSYRGITNPVSPQNVRFCPSDSNASVSRKPVRKKFAKYISLSLRSLYQFMTITTLEKKFSTPFFQI